MTPTGRRRAGWVGAIVVLVAGSVWQPIIAGAQESPAFASDDFDRTELGAPWSVVDPAGDGTVTMEGAGSGDARLLLSVPAGDAHEPWHTNGALRVMRPADDVDFTAVAKFESVPTLRFQMQGIIVEQDADDWLRFEVHHNGNTVKAYAAATTGGSTSGKLTKNGSVGTVSYVRVARSGDLWTLATSGDGTNWSTAGSFTHALDVTAIGVMSGNAGSPAPAHTAVVDYFFEAANPVEPEDGGPPPPGIHTLTTSVAGPGSIVRSPDKPTYGEGEAVTLTATAEPGSTFTGWSGALSGAANPAVVTMTSDVSVTATFAADSTPPVVTDVAVTPSTTSAVVTWTTDEPASSSVSVGPTTAYELGAFGSATSTTSHSVTLTGLAPATTYHYAASSTNASGLVGSAPDATFTTEEPPPVAFPSDDFNRSSLGPAWTVVDPRGDGTVTLTGAGTPDARLGLAVPADVTHDAWHVNNALRVMQAASDVDFSAEVKFESTPSARYQMQGLLVQQDEDDWLRFSVHHTGSAMRAFASATSAGSSAKRIDVGTGSGPIMWLRVDRTGDQWVLRTSLNGSTWSTAGSFTHALDVTSIGPFAGNSGSPAPAFEAVADYVFEPTAPLEPEDTPPSSITHTLTTSVSGDGSIVREPALDAYPEGSQVTLTAVPASGAAFEGWSGDVTGGDNPVVLTIDADKTVQATFQPDATPPVISGVGVSPSTSTAVVTWQTDEPASSSVELGATAAYEMGSFGSATPTQNHSVTLTGLAPGTAYHYRVSSTNGAGLVATASDATFTTPTSTGPAIDVWYGSHQVAGGNGQPQSAYNLLGKVTDPDGVASLSYTLNGGASRNLTVGPDQRRVYSPGDFNADIAFTGLQPGPNDVVLTARDALSNITTTTVVLDKQANDAPLPYTVDWSSMPTVNTRAQPVDGKWGVDGDTVRPLELGYDRLLMVGDISWSDYELTVPVTIHGIGPGHNTHLSGAALVGLALNWQGHTQKNDEQPPYWWYPTGAFAWYRLFDSGPKFELRGNDDFPVVRHARFTLELGQTYMFKARSETEPDGVRYSWKVWPQGQPEPTAWDLSLLETDGPATGSVGLIAHQLDVQFGDVNVVPISP